MKNNCLSKSLTVSLPMLVVCVVLALGATAVAQQPVADSGGGTCSNRTLFGDYGMQVNGTFLAQNVPFSPRTGLCVLWSKFTSTVEET